MRSIKLTNLDFIPTSDAIEYTNAAERLADRTRRPNHIGMVVRQADDGSRWRLTAVASDYTPTWGEVLTGVATPATLGTTNAEGSAQTAARGDHAHAHGQQTATNLHAAATQSGAGFMTATQAKALEGVGLSAAVQVPAGVSTTEVQVTEVLLSTKNTSRTGRFVISMSLAPELVTTRHGELFFGVAWLDDNTQAIEELDVDEANYDAGATPSITVTLPNSVDVVLTLNADHTVTLEVTQSATNARAVWSRYWLDSVLQQIPLMPTFASATSDSAGEVITLAFDLALNEESIPAAEAFVLNGTSATVDSVDVDGVNVILTLSGTVLYGETVTIDYTAPEEDPICALDGDEEVASAEGWACTNIVPPLFVSATTNADGSEITMTYEGALDETSTPTNTDFAIGGDDATVDSLVVTGLTVVLTLSGVIEYADEPTISYTPGTNKIKAAAGYICAALVEEPVANAVAPDFVSATSNADGSEIVVTWAGDLDDGATPPAGAAFTLGGTSATVASVALDGATAILTLETALVEYGETPTVSYAVPEENPLLSAEGYPLVALTTEACANITPPDFVSATSNSAGSEIAITMEAALDEASVPAAEAFTLAGTTATVASVGISGAVVTLTLTGTVLYGESPTVSYAVPGEDPLLELTTEYPCVAFSTESVTNIVPPLYVSATTNAAGDEITLTYEGALNEESTPANTDFAIGGDDATVDTLEVTGATVVLTLTGAIENGDSATISYTAGENPIQSAEEYQCADLTTEAVTNMVPPLFVSATSNNAGSEITVTWEGDLDDGETPPAGAAFTLAGTSATVASVALSGATAVLTLETALVEYGETVTVSYAVPGENPILGACGSPVALLTTESCTNVSPPDFVSAAANADGSTIVITMEAALDEASVPAAGAFTLGGTTATVASVGVSGAEVTLTLTGLVAYDETVVVSYAIPGSNKLQENGTGYVCVAFSEESVTNEVPPVFVSGTTNALGTELLLTYSAALDEGSVPAIGDWLLNGDDAVVNGVYVSGDTVRLTLNGAVEYGDTISLDYTAGVDPLRSAEEYECANLDDESLTNVVPPAYSSGTTDSLGTEITLTFEGALDEDSTPSAECFDLNGIDETVDSLLVSGSTVVLTLSGTMVNGDTVTVDYVVPEENPLLSDEGYELAALSAAAVTNATAPLLVSAVSDATGATIDLTYNVALDEASIPAITAYVLAGTSSVVDTGGVAISGAVVTLTLDQPLVADETVLLDYTVPGENPVQDAAGAASAAALDDQAVTNNTAPLFLSAATDALGETVTLTYASALDEASIPAITAYTLAGTSAVVDTDGVAVTGSTVVLTLDQPIVADETVTVSYAVPGSGKVQSSVGQLAAVALTTESVTNATGPLFVSATTDATGATVVLTYDVALDEASVPAITAYTLGGTSSVVDTAGVGISGTDITLTLDTPIIAGETVTVSYAVPGENEVQSDVTNALAVLLTTESVANITAPLFVSGETSVGGDEIYLTFDSAISETTIDHTAFAINGDDATPAGATASGAVVTMTLTGVIENGDTITVDYTKPGADYLKAAGGDYPVLTDTGWAVVNNVPA